MWLATQKWTSTIFSTEKSQFSLNPFVIRAINSVSTNFIWFRIICLHFFFDCCSFVGYSSITLQFDANLWIQLLWCFNIIIVHPVISNHLTQAERVRSYFIRLTKTKFKYWMGLSITFIAEPQFMNFECYTNAIYLLLYYFSIRFHQYHRCSILFEKKKSIFWWFSAIVIVSNEFHRAAKRGKITNKHTSVRARTLEKNWREEIKHDPNVW